MTIEKNVKQRSGGDSSKEGLMFYLDLLFVPSSLTRAERKSKTL